MSKLLLIDSRVSDIDAILSSLTSDTEYIVFSYTSDTFITIQSKIENTLTKQYTHVAIAQHKYNISTYSMLDAMPLALLFDYDASGEKVGVSVIEPGLESWQPFADFLMWLKTNMGTQYIDLLACDLWADPNWVYVIETLKSQCGLSIRASVDVTGYGGDFILESDNVDLVGIYFTENITNYKYSFVGNDFINLINTKSPWGVYSADAYSNITNKLFEIRGNTTRDATVSGKLTAGSATGNGATGSIRFLNGTTTQTLQWPSGSIPINFTMAAITRWTGGSNFRVLTSDGDSPNVIMGHHGAGYGTAYINADIRTGSGTSTNWLNIVSKTGGTAPNNLLINGTASATGVSSTIASVGRLAINLYGTEKSNFGFSYLMIWDQALTGAEMVIVSGQLAFYLSTGNLPPVQNGIQALLSKKRPWGIYRAVDWNSATNTLPEARGITSRDATKAGAGVVTYIASETGNGANGNISLISGGTTAQLIWPAGSLPSIYALAYITRYTSTSASNQKRILQGSAQNMVFGHWQSNRGLFFDKDTNQWINQTSYGTLTNWLPMAVDVGSSPNNCIVDGIARGTKASTAVTSQQLMINNGLANTEVSDWALSYLIIWDQVLTTVEITGVSNMLLSYLGTGALPATTDFVLNGYFTGPALTPNTFTYYASPFAAIVNWTISVTTANVNIAIANQSTTWGYTSLPAGVTQWLIIQHGVGTSSISQNIYFSHIGRYQLTYYTQCRAGFGTNVITLGASVGSTSQSSLVSVTNWELRTLEFTITSVGTQTLTFNTSCTAGGDNSIYLTAINIAEVYGAPFAPTLVSVTPGNKQLSIVLTAPTDNGGEPITTYKYSLNGGALVSAATTSTSFTISGLSDNTSYNVRVAATNIIGDSSNSNVISATTWNVPGAPTIDSVTASSQTIQINFTAPASNGGSAITTYKYSLNNGSNFTDALTTTSPITVTGLTNGQTYQVILRATSAVGDSANSNMISILVGTVPSAPTLISINEGNTQLDVSFNAPSSNGGSAITTYKYSLNGGALVDASTTTSPFSITSLTGGTMYTVALYATNSVGDSSSSNVLVGTPFSVPSKPSITIQIGTGSIIVTSVTGSNGGRTITEYKYSTDGVNYTSTGSATVPFTIPSLTQGQGYNVTVKSTNVAGDSVASDASYGLLVDVPSPPTITGLTLLSKSVLVAFTNGSDGGAAISDTKYSVNGETYVAGNGTTSPLLIPNLKEGVTYTVSLKSTNSVGDSIDSDLSSVFLPYTYNYENPLSIDSNGEVFVMTLRNELNDTYHYKYSYDGLNWTSQSFPTSALSAYNPYNVKWTGTQFLISGNVSSGGSNALLRSYDGVDFSISKTTTTNQIYDLETNLEYRNTITFPINTTLILGGVSNDTVKISYSYDSGSTWLPSTNSNSVFPVSANDAVWNGKIWVAVGEGQQPVYDSGTSSWTVTEQTGNTIATSDNGKTWIGRGKHMFSIRGNAVDWSRESNLIVAVGDGSQNSIAYSHDGTYWLGCGKSMFETGKSIKWNGQIWVAGGSKETNTQKSIAYSYDGKSWQQPTQSDLFQTSADTVTWNGSQWVVYGTDPTYNVATSNDGIVWKMINDINYASPTPFYNGTQYLKIQSNQVAESPDGTFWGTPQSVANMSVLKKFAWNRSNEGVPFIQPISLAFGEGANTIGYSYDGISWTGLGKSIFTTRGNNGVWNGKIWVAVGTGTHWCAYSYDGLYWDGLTNELFTEAYDIAWNGYVFVAVGEGNTRIAVSANGIHWSPVRNSASIFTQRATAIKWTGKAWVAYGSGGNTTATCLEPNGTVWTASSKKNMTITDLSSVIVLAYGPNVTSAPASSTFVGTYNNTGYEAYRAIDNDMATYFNTNSNYNSSTGLSVTGVQFTFNNVSGSISGEYIIVDANQLLTVKSYLVSFRTPPGQQTVLREWALVALPGNNTWQNLFSTNVDLLHRGYINTIPETVDGLSVQYVNLFENTSQYRIYMLVFGKSFGTDINITRLDLFYESDTTNTVSKYLKPVVTRNSVLHPVTLMSYYHTLYLAADLSNNVISNNQVASPPFVFSEYGTLTRYFVKTINPVFYGSNNQIITSSGYDGQRLFITTLDGKLLYMSNDQANNYANFDNSFNNTTITTNLPTIYTSCYNQNFILLGGTGNSVITYNTMDANITSWYTTNANNIFTSVYGLTSNAGYSNVYVPNALYLNAGDKLSVVTPKAINQSVTSNTAITVDLNKPYL